MTPSIVVVSNLIFLILIGCVGGQARPDRLDLEHADAVKRLHFVPIDLQNLQEGCFGSMNYEGTAN
jgi:hypothetical protein